MAIGRLCDAIDGCSAGAFGRSIGGGTWFVRSRRYSVGDCSSTYGDVEYGSNMGS